MMVTWSLDTTNGSEYYFVLYLKTIVHTSNFRFFYFDLFSIESRKKNH